MTVSSFGAAPSALGYLYQSEVALIETLRRMYDDPSTSVSLELFDDVTWETDGAPDDLLQTKHRLDRAGNLSDASPDLWHTLRVWAERQTPAGDSALLTLMTTAVAPDGSAASKLRRDDARDEAAALSILERSARTSTNQTTKAARKAFLALSPEERTQMLSRISIIDEAPSITNLDEAFDRELRLVAHARFRGPLIERLRSWWSGRVMRHLAEVAAGDVHSRISAEEIAAEIADLQDKLRSDNLPLDFLDTTEPTDADVDADHRPFIEQLRLIMIKDRRLRLAVRSHHRAFEQRSRWMREELLEYGELEQYEASLIEQWELTSAREDDLPEEATEDDRVAVGVRVLDAAEKFTTNIRARCTAPYVMVGSLHMLADQRRIGWHPDWVQRLREILDDPGAPASDDAAAA